MSYIYKNIIAATDTEVLPLHTIDTFTSISICNKGTDCSTDIYLSRTLEDVGAKLRAQGIQDTKDVVYFLYQTVIKQYTTLILDPSDFSFDNSLYSLYIKGSQNLDVIINATPSTTKPLKTDDVVPEPISDPYIGGAGGTGGGGY